MSQKHFNKKCKCLKLKKKCENSGVIDISKLCEDEYTNKLYDNGTLDFMYNIMQSVTQSLRCTTGKDFEQIIKNISETWL